ncbi:MAG: class II D-tagatose-bisphosphate aldolase, non-catalytic subunit [Clostridia bacterium]|nr:class II D-tagatose-bisphosphate aldolase, non-catalytic subunit [Clostridia bacterium]
MNEIGLIQLIEISRFLKEKTTLLGIGPMSKTVVDASIESAIENDFPLFFIASRNQIDRSEFGYGYVETWDQRKFSSYIEKVTKKLEFNGLLFKCRDHGGPWQRDEELMNKIPVETSMNNALDSYKADIDAGFNFLHIDTSRDPNYSGMVPYDVAIDRAIYLMKAIEEYRLKRRKEGLYYEISLEETSSICSVINEFKYFVDLIMNQISTYKLPKPVFIVGNTGTLTRMDKNVGSFNPEIVEKLKKISEKYGMILKEHNADYLDSQCLKMHPELGIGMANVAPEFGKLETDALIKLAMMEDSYFSENNIEKVDRSNFLPIIFSHITRSNKWAKWSLNKDAGMDSIDNPEFKELMIKVCGHYFYSKDELEAARKTLFANVKKLNIMKNPEEYVKNNIKTGIQRYVDAFNLKNLTSKVMEYRSFEKKNIVG